MAAGANEAGADRIFLMAYDYRTGASEPGATSPIDRRDGDEKDLPWSLDLYAPLGVPPEKLLLGLPLYGVTWPVVGPEIGAPATGAARPGSCATTSTSCATRRPCPQRDEIESVEVYALGSRRQHRPARDRRPRPRRPRDRRRPRRPRRASSASAVGDAVGDAGVAAVVVADPLDRPDLERRLRRLARDAGDQARARARTGPRRQSGSGPSATSAGCPATRSSCAGSRPSEPLP